MKTFRITCVRWANWSDLGLPLYKLWNKENPLPPNFWSRIWEYPFAVSHVPKNSNCLDVGGTYPFVLFKNFPEALSADARDLNALDHPLHKGQWPQGKLLVTDAHKLPFEDDAFDFSFCISALEEMPDPTSVIREMLRVTREKVVITIDISETLGMPWETLVKLSRFLQFEIPPVPADRLVSSDRKLRSLGITPNDQNKHIRVLGVIVEDDDPVHRTCGIIVPHWESYQFLQMCIKKIKEQKNKKIEQHIYIVDDNSHDGSFEKIQDSWGDDPALTILQLHRPNKGVPDVGSLLDYGIQQAKERYVCMIDADIFPLSPHWLSFPIHLLEKYHCSSVGCDTGLSNSYMQLCPGEWQNETGYNQNFTLFDNDNFTCTNNFYRMMKSTLAKIVSEQIGFSSRAVPRSVAVTLIDKVKRRLRSLLTPRRPIQGYYCPAGCDNGVSANHFIDINKLGPKFNIPLISWVCLTPHDGVFGQNICGLVFHFALSTRALSRIRREIADPGASYLRYSQKILSEGFTDELLEELVSQCVLRPGGYDGSIPVSYYATAKESFDEEFQLYLQGQI